MKHLVLAACLFTTAAAGAQTVWRCGPDGRDYRDAPCAQGRAVEVADDRTEAERSAARKVAAQDRALAQRLAKQRLALERERRAEGNGLAGFATTPPLRATARAPATPKPGPKAGPRKPAAGETYRGAAPSSPRATG
jgi:hypothetical protein